MGKLKRSTLFKEEYMEAGLRELRHVYNIKVSDNFTGMVIQRLSKTSITLYTYFNYTPVILGVFLVASCVSLLLFIGEFLRDISSYHTPNIFDIFKNIDPGTFFLLLVSSIPYTATFFIVLNLILVIFLFKKSASLLLYNGK